MLKCTNTQHLHRITNKDETVQYKKRGKNKTGLEDSLSLAHTLSPLYPIQISLSSWIVPLVYPFFLLPRSLQFRNEVVGCSVSMCLCVGNASCIPNSYRKFQPGKPLSPPHHPLRSISFLFLSIKLRNYFKVETKCAVHFLIARKCVSIWQLSNMWLAIARIQNPGLFMPKTPPHSIHLRLGLFGIQIASHRVCVLNVLPASGDMNYSKKKQQQHNKKNLEKGVNNFSSPPRTNILKRCAAYKRGQRCFRFSQLEQECYCHMWL